MKIIYYDRYQRSDFHVHANSSSKCFYVPDRNVVFGVERFGSFGAETFFVNTDKRILDEAESIANNNIPKNDIVFTDIKTIECDSNEIDELIKEFFTKKELEKMIEFTVKKIYKKVKNES